jgi:hypothetical protein
MTDQLTRIEEKLDRILQLLEKPKRKKKAKLDIPVTAFQDWWALYPRKVGKPAALQAWKRIMPNPELQKILLDDIRARTKAWKGTPLHFIPHPSTFLNQSRYKDPIEHSIPEVQVLRVPSEINALIAFAVERGIHARPGEDTWEFRKRVEDSI